MCSFAFPERGIILPDLLVSLKRYPKSFTPPYQHISSHSMSRTNRIRSSVNIGAFPSLLLGFCHPRAYHSATTNKRRWQFQGSSDLGSEWAVWKGPRGTGCRKHTHSYPRFWQDNTASVAKAIGAASVTVFACPLCFNFPGDGYRSNKISSHLLLAKRVLFAYREL